MKPLRLSRLLHRTAATAALLLLSTGGAHAATVFDQSTPLPSSGNRADLWSADDFTLSASSLLSGATLYLRYYRTDGVVPGINYALYADNSGTPGAILQLAAATPAVTDLSPTSENYALFAWAFNFSTPIEALAGTRYWFGVQQGSDRVNVGLIDSGNPGATALTTFYGPAPGSYNIALPRGLAFSLQGSAISSPGGVPEPASWAMLIAGFGAIGTVIRRRPRASVRFA